MEVYELLVKLVRYNFKLDRGKQAVQASEENEQEAWNAAILFEKAIASWDISGITVSLSSTQYDVLSGNGKNAESSSATNSKQIRIIMYQEFQELQDIYYRDLGIILPEVRVHIDADMEGNTFRFQLNDLRLPPITGLEQHQLIVPDATVDNLARLGITAKATFDPLTNRECAIIEDEQDAAKVRDDTNLTSWEPYLWVLQSISRAIKRNIGDFLNTDAVKYNMNVLQPVFPVLVERILAHFGVVKLTQILRNLLEEDYSLKHLLPILQTFLPINAATPIDLTRYDVFFPPTTNFCLVLEGRAENIVDYVNYVRMAFKRHISLKYTNEDNILFAYLVHPEIEMRIRSIDEQPLSDDEYDNLMNVILDLVQQLKPA